MNKLQILPALLIMILFSTPGISQNIKPTTPKELDASIEKRNELRDNSIFKNYPIRSVGPVVMSGRITDIAVHPENPRIFYVGYASGGVFKTTNSGNSMEPVFDHQDALGIGDLAIFEADPEVVWVGTGENNSSRSSYAGAGVFKSMDGGNSWQYSGLRGTQHIGRVVTHPTDVNTVWVAALGPLYSYTSDRGVYKTTDGGKNWEKTLFIDDSTGVIDLLIHPENPDILWATTWEKDRKAWNFKESGEGSAIYKSIDGGETWAKSVKGFPQGADIGRIGLDVSLTNPDVLYAVLDNQFETKEEREANPDVLSQSSFIEMSKKEFANLDDKKLNQYLRRGGFPEKYNAENVKKDVAAGLYEPKALAEFLGDANAALFDTQVNGAEVYRSDDGGESWVKTHDYVINNVFFTYGYYFGEIRIDPNDENTIYIFGVPFIKSTDGGKTWTEKADNQPVHVDHHALWINPEDSEHLLLGNDGGLYESHDGGENFIHHNTVAVGQFYTVNVDMEEPYNIYGGLQDNGTFYGPSTSTPNRDRPWKRLFGGDGMHVAPSPEDPEEIVVGFQYGNYFLIDLEDNETTRITPRHDVGEPRYRYNWNTPVNLSHHNPEIIYFGSQKLNRSYDQGKTWTAISPDLTNDLPNGDVPYSTLTTIAESPLNANIIWVGTDDGNIQLTKTAGTTWKNVAKNGLPKNLWVSEVHASVYDEAAAYVSLNGYRYDNFETHIYKTDDFGKTWKSLKGNLPDEVVNVILQDPEVPEILYAGLDHGTYISFDDGKEWHYLANMPNVASYDMVVHPRDLDLVIGTHGRSIWVMDVEPLHELSIRMDETITGFSPQDIRSSSRWGQKTTPFRDRIMPEVELLYFLNEGNSDVEIQVKDKDDKTVYKIETDGTKGFNSFSWDLVIKKEKEDRYSFLGKGEYTLVFKSGKSKHEVPFNVK